MKNLRDIGKTGVILVAFSMLVGCGVSDASKPESSSIEIKKDGSVISTAIESFEQSYYDLNELKQMAEEEISAYNLSSGEESISLESLKEDDEVVTMKMSYKDSGDYAHFNSETLIYETVEEASGNGQTIPSDLVDTDGENVTSDDFAGLSSEHVLITSNKTIVTFPYKVKYVSKGVTILGSKTVDLSGIDEENLAYIILNK